MTALSDFPPDVQAAAKAATERWFFDSDADLEVIFAEVVMADRRVRPGARTVGLTAHQRRVFEYLASFIAQQGIAPSYDQIQAHLGLKSKSSVHRVIHELEERGAIQRLPNRARAITIIANPASQQEQA